MPTDLSTATRDLERLKTVNRQLIDDNWYDNTGNALRLHKDQAYRIKKFVNWMDGEGLSWYVAKLSDYRDHLLAMGYKPGTVAGHLSTVRARIKLLLADNTTRDTFARMAQAHGAVSFSDLAAVVNEMVRRIENNIDPVNSGVKQTSRQDVVDSEHHRLSTRQCNDLMRQIDLTTLPGMRDAALIALMLATGIRENEAVHLTVDDLRQSLNGEPSLWVRHGKGRKQRAVPWGENIFVLQIVDAWLRRASIHQGRVLRSFYKPRRDKQTGETLPPKMRQSLSVRALQNIIANYPITDDHGVLIRVRPHDLRRTYARRQYAMGLDPLRIQQNLGHSSLETTLGYIGELDAAERRGKRMFDFDLKQLQRL